MPEFVRDVEAIRERASRKIEEGAVTESYRGDVQKTISVLNEALATEIVCVLRYQHHYFMATGVHGSSVAAEFKEHADAEREHADRIAERIQQLGGKPDFNPRSLVERSVSQYVEGETLADMIREDLIAERIVIEVYQEMIRFFRDNDPTTRTMIEEILADEEEHASDLADLLYVVDPRTGQTEGQDPGTTPLQWRKEMRSERQQPARGAQASGDRGPSSPGSAGQNPLAHEPEVVLAELEREQNRGRGGNDRGNQRGRAASPLASAEPARTPGAGGRPMNRRGRQPEEEVEIETANGPVEGQSGGTRSVSVTNKNRKQKSRRAA
jgi:bacterioferritin